MKTICLDNVFNLDELFWLYNNLLKTNGWNLMIKPEDHKYLGQDKLYGNIGNLQIDINSNWFSYFQGLVFRINKILQEEKKIKINSNIKRIYLNATFFKSNHWLHIDSKDVNDTSMLIMFTPQWQDSWSGSFFVDENEFKMKPGRIIIYNSNKFHTGTNPIEECPYLRLTCNIVLKSDLD